MMQSQSLSSGKPGGEATLGYTEPSSPPGVTMMQGDPAARVATRKDREIIIIPSHRLSDLNLVNYLLAKQKRGALVQTHIVSEKGRLILGVRAYPKSHKAPAVVAFIVLEATGEFQSEFRHKDKALQMQVYGMWNTPAEFLPITEKLRKAIPGVIPARHYTLRSKRTVFFDGEYLSVSLLLARKRDRAFHPADSPAA